MGAGFEPRPRKDFTDWTSWHPHFSFAWWVIVCFFFCLYVVGYCSYFGKKIDPEPGRCRRTDGKKWRCSKDAHPNSKYCERHMNRSRYRSRKPVESQNTSQSLSTTVGVDIGGNRSSIGSGGGGGSRSLSFQNPPLQPLGTREGLCFRSNMSQSQMAAIPYGIPNKEYRYMSSLFLVKI